MNLMSKKSIEIVFPGYLMLRLIPSDEMNSDWPCIRPRRWKRRHMIESLAGEEMIDEMERRAGFKDDVHERGRTFC